MNGLDCDITFMLRHPYLFTVLMMVLLPCMTLIIMQLFRYLEMIISKEDE